MTMAQVPKIIPSAVVRVAPKPAPTPAVTGGRVASGALNVAAVGGPAVEEIAAQGGIAYEEAGVLFRDYATLPESEKAAEPVENSGLGGLTLNLGSLFHIQELADRADQGREGPGFEEISRRAAKASEAYREIQEITGAPTDPVGGNLSLQL